MKGSLTVEASYVFPFCFFVIFIVCQLGCYQYNQAVLKMTGYESIVRTMEERELNDKAIEEQLENLAETLAQERTIGMKNLEVTVKMTATKIVLTYAGVQTAIESPTEVTVVYERTNPEWTLRMAREIVRN